MPFDRRAFLVASAALVLAGCAPRGPDGATIETPAPLPTATPTPTPLGLDLSDLPEGVYGVWGTWDGRVVAHDSDRRLRMCSTMKLPLAALVLTQARDRRLDLAEALTWSAEELVGHSPFTRSRPDGRATVGELAEAAARESDNTATNILIDRVGGLPALTAFARGHGDEVTRFDRYEIAMNIRDGDLDTTTAEAFGRLALALVEDLGPERSGPLAAWLPGLDGRRIAAAAPAGLDLVHKTGTSGDGALNDVAVLFRDGLAAGCLAVFTDSTAASEETVAQVAQRAFAALVAG